MPLNLPQLEADILQMVVALQDETDLKKSQQAYARRLARLVDNYVRSATIVFPPGSIQILAAGTAGTNPAPVVGRLT